jgi:hypothetical protein
VKDEKGPAETVIVAAVAVSTQTLSGPVYGCTLRGACNSNTSPCIPCLRSLKAFSSRATCRLCTIDFRRFDTLLSCVVLNGLSVLE